MGCVASTAVERGTLPKYDNSKRYPIVGEDEIMAEKDHGTSKSQVQNKLRWKCNRKKADEICNFNRHYAEPSGSAEKNKRFAKELALAKKNGVTVEFYDSNTGNLIFEAPKGRSHDEFWLESARHGWPSFRDEEVNWGHVRCLKNGECVSLDGTHLGHNLPDHSGNRYCINLVSIAGRPQLKDALNGEER